MFRAKYKYNADKEKNTIHIVDLYNSKNPTMSVTNDAENVISDILKEVSWINEETSFTYTDTEGDICRIIPEIDLRTKQCYTVKFEFMPYAL